MKHIAMLMVFTGDGKGKTTAAVGQAIRAVGQKRRVFMIQFIKSPKWPSGEDAILGQFAPRVRFKKAGLGFVGILGDALPLHEHRKAASAALAEASEAAASAAYDLMILDEVNVALHLGLLTLDEVLSFLKITPPGADVIFTGRNAHPEILARAELITECREVRHPYALRVRARRGVEY